MPVAGYLLGLALVMIVTGTPPTDERVYPKFAGAVVVLAVGALAPVAATVAGAAAVLVVLAAWMVVSGVGPGQGPAVGGEGGSQVGGLEDLDGAAQARQL